TNNYYLCVKRFNQSALRSEDPVFKVCRFYFPRNYYLEVYFIRSLNPKYLLYDREQNNNRINNYNRTITLV
ncbi:uncharacterized protein B0T23DRAFT_324924, partial [Neurospora hispaniola]